MATMLPHLTFENFEAWVKVDDKDTQAYCIETDKAKKEVTCWIASEAGKTFSILCQKSHTECNCSGSTTLDGFDTGSFLLRKAQDNHPTEICGLVTSKTTMRPFRFSPISLTDDDAFLSSSSSTSNIGEIKLTFRRARMKGGDIEFDRVFVPSIPEQQKVHERSKKAITHQVSFGEDVICDHPAPVNAVRKERLVTFIFRYRPLDMLQAIGIAPRRPPAPSPTSEIPTETSHAGSSKSKRKAAEVQSESEAETDEDGSDVDELNALRAAEALVKKIKNARLAKKEARQKKKVKTETLNFLIPGEVVGFT
ncbi:hypothetical protein B0H34DRAFT_732740 [Crassisporium funariophilum]|nr:hypothetical protein B0H34DRAFT_732740 [Crassisporium funariophilum]